MRLSEAEISVCFLIAVLKLRVLFVCFVISVCMYNSCFLCLAFTLSHSCLPTKVGVLLGKYLGAFNFMAKFKGHGKKSN